MTGDPPVAVPLRLLRAGAVAVLSGATVYAGFSGDPTGVSDWDQLWIGGRALLAGQDPYAAVTPENSPWPLVYPLPAVLLMLPFTALPLPLARSVWFAVGAGALAYAWSGRPAWRLLGLLSGAFIWSIRVAQWTPLLVASLWLPALGVLLVAKPTTGLILWIRSPTWPPVAGAVVLLAASFLVMPEWVQSWRHATGYIYHEPALIRPGGFLMLLALTRWRRPEARMLGALACLPAAGGVPYELLLLFGVARTFVEWVAVAVLSWGVVAWAWHLVPLTRGEELSFVAGLWPAMLLLGYLPAVLMVLRRPNKSPRDELLGSDTGV